MHKYTRLGIVPIEVVREFQEQQKDVHPKLRQKLHVCGVSVKVFGSSKRLETFFHHGTRCSSCGIEATHYAVERNLESNNESYHLNLWGYDGEGNEVLFTHDHTLARSAGGKDDLSNTTTMCHECNFAKSLVEVRNPKRI